MKFKILKGTELFKHFATLRKEMNDALAASNALAESIGATDAAIIPGYYIAGGADAFYFPNDNPPANFKVKGKSWQNLYFPKVHKDNKELLDKIDGLPRVRTSQLTDLLNFGTLEMTAHQGGLSIMQCPAVVWTNTYILVDFGESTKYKPLPDMIEITGSEYNQLKEKHERSQKKKAKS